MAKREGREQQGSCKRATAQGITDNIQLDDERRISFLNPAKLAPKIVLANDGSKQDCLFSGALLAASKAPSPS